MKRYVCTVATGLLLALMSTGTAAALEPLPLPLPGQSGTQEVTFGDQTAQQSNDADVTQKQGNGNVNVAPAIAVFGDAETTTVQGSGNTATANVDQSNSADQSQSSEQKQSLDQEGGSCCDGQSQTGEQTATFGDQTADQSNTAQVDQWQGNGNVNIAPAVAIFGDAETKTVQGSGNEANADVTQSNEASQSQDSTQKQWLDQDGGGCCKPPVRCDKPDRCSPKKEHGEYSKTPKDGHSCCGGQSQTGEQTATFGDQTADQSNTAQVDQWQGNGNVNIAPAVAIFGDAETKTVQGSGNTATANVDQSNSADQSQSSEQKQSLEQDGGGCCKPPARCVKPDPCSPKKEHGGYQKGSYGKEGQQDRCCEHGQSQTGEQTADFGDQTAQQSNTADVTQKQGNLNGSFAPAFAFGKGKGDSCGSKCGKPAYGGHSFGGDAETTTVQGSGNTATADVGQSNSADQSQSAYQRQSVVDMCKGLVYR
jgi:hypothetical protein